MSALERELRELGAMLDWPAAPDVASQLAAAVVAPVPRRPRRLRLVLVAAIVVLAAILGVLAVPSARSAVLDWLGIGGARISVVDELPPVRTVPGLEILGDPVSLDEAHVRAGFPFADPPDGEPAPDEIRVAPGGRVSYLWRDGPGLRLLVTQFPGSVDNPVIVKKLVTGRTTVEELDVDGRPAVWLVGGPHVILFVSPEGDVREQEGWLAGNTLLVDRDGVTIRVEGALSRSAAVTLVRAMTG